MSFPLRAAVVLVATASLTGCHKAPVHVPAPVPSLNVPVPDTRLVIPSPLVEAPVEVQAPPDPPPVATPPPRTRESSPVRPPQPAPTPPPAATPPASEASSPVPRDHSQGCRAGKQSARAPDQRRARPRAHPAGRAHARRTGPLRQRPAIRQTGQSRAGCEELCVRRRTGGQGRDAGDDARQGWRPGEYFFLTSSHCA